MNELLLQIYDKLAQLEALIAERNALADRYEALRARLNKFAESNDLDDLKDPAWRITLPSQGMVSPAIQTPADYNSMPLDQWALANLNGAMPVVGMPNCYEVRAEVIPDPVVFTMQNKIEGALGNEPQWSDSYDKPVEWQQPD